MDTEQIQAMFGNLGMSKQDYDQIAKNMTKAIGATTSEAIANTQNVSNQDVYASYIAQESTINTAQSQYNQPVATDTINNIFNAGLSNTTKAMTDLLKLDAQQADMMIDAALESIKLAQNGQHHKEEMDLAWKEYELAQDELGFQKEKFEDEMALKWEEFYLDEEKLAFQKDKWEEEFGFEKTKWEEEFAFEQKKHEEEMSFAEKKHEEEMAYKYEALAAQAAEDSKVDYSDLADAVKNPTSKASSVSTVPNTGSSQPAYKVTYDDGTSYTVYPGDPGYEDAEATYSKNKTVDTKVEKKTNEEKIQEKQAEITNEGDKWYENDDDGWDAIN